VRINYRKYFKSITFVKNFVELILILNKIHKYDEKR
jgi:hypothetical protein